MTSGEAPEDGADGLRGDALYFRSGGTEQVWPLTDLTAVQPSSTALQVKLRNGPIISMKFPTGSALLWEGRLCAGLQRCYDALGRGTIIEFQPRIQCR